MPRLTWNGYGKAGVRLVKVDRSGPAHGLIDLTVDLQLQGEFDAAHTAGDNSCVLPTDTMKNTVYALAAKGPVDPPEPFAERLGRHLLEHCPSARRAVIRLALHRWDRLAEKGGPHHHAFARGPAERRLALVTVDGSGGTIEAGLEGLGLLKTTDSGFGGFLRDAFTTLGDTEDRILATDVTARWRYAGPPVDYGQAWTGIRQAMIDTFAGHRSASVQQTLYAMGEAALRACNEVAEIRLLLPNRHHLPVDLTPFGLENRNEIFVATSEPYGRIEAVITR